MIQLYIDTNILIDVLTGRNGSEASKRLFALAHLRKIQSSVSALSFVNAVYICRRYDMNIENVLFSLKSISSFIRVEDLSGANVVSSLTSKWKDYEDATQDYCAKEQGITHIVTHNVKDFSKSTLSVVTPEDALRLI